MSYNEYRRMKATQASTQAINTASTALGTGLMVAAAASNAVPVGGQIAAGALALTGILLKVFGGKRAERRAGERQQREATAQRQRQEVQKTAKLDRNPLVGGAPAPQGPMLNQPTIDYPEQPTPTTYQETGQEYGREV